MIDPTSTLNCPRQVSHVTLARGGVAKRRQEIYDHFHATDACQQYFLDAAREDEYVAYYTSMYLLQDSTESLLEHRARGFAPPSLARYLEFWGVMQATIIQQDAIAEIYKVVLGNALDARTNNLKSWLQIRELRNTCAGHPAKKSIPRSQPLTRTFMGRNFGDYNGVTYEMWQQGLGTSHPRVSLGSLLDDYAREAEVELMAILNGMKGRWP